MRMLLLTAALVAPMAVWADAHPPVNGSFEASARSNGSWNLYGAIPGRTANPALETRTNTAALANGLSFGVGNGWIAAPGLAANKSGDNQWSQVNYNFTAHSSTATTPSVMATGNSGSSGTSLDKVSVAAATPEPNNYALMFAALAAVGFVARRRRPR